METTATPKQINPTDALYVKALKDGDNRMSRKFFYEETAGILHRIRMEVFRGQVDFDEMVSELYLYLSRDGWSRLDSFGGQNNCRLRTWMIPVAWRFFLGIRERMLSSRNADGYDMATLDGTSDDDLRIQIAIDVNTEDAEPPLRRHHTPAPHRGLSCAGCGRNARHEGGKRIQPQAPRHRAVH